MSSEHSPAGSNASQEDVWNLDDNTVAQVISSVQESSNENIDYVIDARVVDSPARGTS